MPELVVALDVPTIIQAHRLVARLRPAVRWFKVGLELFTAAGPEAVALVQAEGGAVLLDLKLHDIPHTVAGAVRSAARLRAGMLTIHLAGGTAMVRAAAEAARRAGTGLRILGITRLTSEAAAPGDPVPSIAGTAKAAAHLGVDGVVVSAHEAAAVRAACPAGFLIATPGIRSAPVAGDDQARVATVAEAVRAGSDLLIVGRPVVQDPDPRAAAARVLAEMTAEGAVL